MQECTKNKQGKIGTNCQIGSFGTILVCTNYPMTIHNKVVHQLNPPSSIQHIKVLIEFHFLHKFCMETRCFLEKFTQLEKKFTRPLVATVVTNFKSVQVLSHWSNFNMYKASRQCAPSCEFAMHQRKCNCNVCSCVAFLLYASSSCAFLEYLITCFLMLRYACIADNGLEFPQCVSKCAFSH